MKTFFTSQTNSGKWSISAGFTFVVAMGLSLIFAAFVGGDSLAIINNRLWAILSLILSLIFTLSGLLSFVCGLYTLIKHREWSIWKPLVALYALTAFLFLLGRFIFPR